MPRAGAGGTAVRQRNLLNARDRLGASIIEIVAADDAEHGPEVIEQLRLKNVAAYARLVSDLAHFRKLATERNTQTRRKPRALRMEQAKETAKQAAELRRDNAIICNPAGPCRGSRSGQRDRPSVPFNRTFFS